MSWIRAVFLAAASAALIGCAQPASGPPETSAVRSASEQRTGDELHSKLVAQYGGIYTNRALTSYVERVGGRVAAVSEQPGAKWTFTVLDTPVVNAFAIPGGYVYVTRGMVAIANDEAQLAGVLGHEIGHVTAGHSALRQSRTQTAGLGVLAGAIGLAALGIDPALLGEALQAAAGGALASYSRNDELQADYLGIRYLAKAGYDPLAQADVLDQLAASSRIEAQASGRGYDPNRVDFFASHPATGPRTRQAVETAQTQGQIAADARERGRDRYLDAIDGMVYGPSPDQGFADGTRFFHPTLDFTFEAPEGFRLQNRPEAVYGSGPGNARLIFDGAKDPGGSLTAYIEDVWTGQIAKAMRTGTLQRLESHRINGLEAARAILPVEVEGRAWTTLLVALRHKGKLYRFTGLSPSNLRAIPALAAAADSFRSLTPQERAATRTRRIEVVRVGQGDTAESLARRMRVDDLALERFRALNGLAAGESPPPGSRVKLIR